MGGGGGFGVSDEGCGGSTRWGVVSSDEEWPPLGFTDDSDVSDKELLLLIEEVARGGVGFNEDDDGGEQPDELYDECGWVGS